MMRPIALVMAWLFLVLAFIGIVVPGLPTVPFLLLAAWFAARGSPRLHRWLYAHPRLGKILIDWETRKAISRRTKIVAIAMLVVSWIVMYWRVSSPWMLALVTVLFLGVATYLASRPEPERASKTR